MTLGSHQTSIGKTQVHITPRWILEVLGPFDLDPAAADPRPWDCAAVNYTERDDGLRFGRPFLNPPFVPLWIRKLARHGCGTALLHARTETDWFEPIWESATVILFGVVHLLRGEHVYPIVRLDKRQWKSRKYGMQTRPHLDPIEWRTPGAGGPKLAPQSPTPQLTGPATAPTPALAPTPAPTAPAPTAAPTPAPAPATPRASTILDNTKPVKPVTVAELIADEIPWK
jgi:hypothetical protein